MNAAIHTLTFSTTTKELTNLTGRDHRHSALTPGTPRDGDYFEMFNSPQIIIVRDSKMDAQKSICEHNNPIIQARD